MSSPSAPPLNPRLNGLSQAAVRGVVETAQALELGRAGDADRHVTGLLALYPDHPEVLWLAAGVHNLRGEHAQAIAVLRRALAARPDEARYHNTLGATLIDASDYDGAIATLQHATQLDPRLTVAWFNLGLALMRSMRVDESAAALRRALELSPHEPTARVILADMLRAQGRDADAVAEYRSVLTRNAQAGMAWWGLADIKSLRLGDGEIAKLRAAMAQPRTAESDLVAMGFTLAKALEDQGCYADSLAALDAAHARARSQCSWNAQAHSAAVDAVIGAFARSVHTEGGQLGSEVIFVASLPRSGSTLVEQMLAAHSQIEGAGELPDLPLVLTEESQRRAQQFPHWVGAMQAADWERLGHRYLERTRHWRRQRPRFVDKLPYNWFYIGALRAMLPGAHVILLRRDPLETCFSCYRQLLAGNDYTHTYSSLAQFWRDFDRAATHWRTQHPLHVRESVYEHLIADPEMRIRELLAFCDLPFEPGCLEFHRIARDVHTPSATQVRTPMRRDTARAVRYGALLDPLRAELGMAPFSADRV